MIHNLLKGENFPVDDWFEDYGSDLFEVFEAYYSEHDCWDGFKENILNCSGKMYALFVAVVYAQEQKNTERQKACLWSLLKNKAVDDGVLDILSDYAYQYPDLLDVMLELLKVQKDLKNVSSAALWQIYRKYQKEDVSIAYKALDVFYLWLAKLKRPVDVCADYINFLQCVREKEVVLGEKVYGYHFAQLQKILQLLAPKNASSDICRMILYAMNCRLYLIADKLSLAAIYLDEFIDSARESDLISALSCRIFNEETSAQMLSLLSDLQQKVGDNRLLSLELLKLITEAWREETCERLHVLDREAFKFETWDTIDAYLKRGVFSPREEKWLELCCKTASCASGDVGYFSTQPLWLALKLKKFIAIYPILEKFKDYAEQIFDEQMEVLESFLEEDCNYIYWKEWEKVLGEFWCEATASDIAKLVHLLAGYEPANSPMKIWAKAKNFDFTNWGEKLKYTSQLESLLKALDVD